ncbi:hypothetical protein AAFF_G00425220 [Aldrovandia affinis]|uniref:Leucine-rich repeat-containing protein 43 n=1 Tax=Aldrovandia affinis TaxID=143900 RepID=A0AAD7X028_9TELE|nr:hypothetical protein AAFF_G00425220 [Aldrovandia affinis]
MSYQTVSSAFEEQLRGLCLQDFPCGQGSWIGWLGSGAGWSKPRGQGSAEQSWGYNEQDEGRGGSGTEEQEDLIELLTSPLSPWRQEEEESWSPQALALRELSVRSPARLSSDFIRDCFITLRIVDKGVSVIDDGVLKFTKMEELVLTANRIADLPSGHLPQSLRVLELYANQVSSLENLCQRPPPCLQHLGLGLNRLGSPVDAHFLTAAFWPQLVSLDLSWSGFVEQLVLVDSLSTLPSLRTLALEGNPLTLTPSYPGFILHSLPRLLCLDGRRVTPDDRYGFRGLAKTRDAVTDEAVVTVAVHKMRGIPDPSLANDSSTSEFPVVSYRYLVTYEFLGQLPVNKAAGRGLVTPMEQAGGRCETPPDWSRSCEEEACHTAPDPGPPGGVEDSGASENHSCPVTVNSTTKLPWAEVMEYNHTALYRASDLPALKSFFLRGLRVTVEEEKVLSWPASLGENMGTKPATDKKGTARERSARPVSNTCSNQKAKDRRKKKESQVDLVQDAPVRRNLGSAHVELRDLLSGGNQVHWLCDFGVLMEQSGRVMAAQEKELSKKVKEDKNKEEKKVHPAGESTAAQRNTPSKSKGRGKKESEAEGHAENLPNQLEPLTVEFSVHLQKWQTASQADRT